MRTTAAALGLAIASLAIAWPARAAMMAHHDLASLALEADAIVRAERTGGPDDAATYRVVRVLAGGGVRAGETITIAQSVYFVDARATFAPPLAGPVEPSAFLFLRAGRDPSQPAWSLVGSGLRLVAGGRAYRFEQRSNPRARSDRGRARVGARGARGVRRALGAPRGGPDAHALAASATGGERRVRYRVVAAPGLTVRFRRVTLRRSDGSACDAEPIRASSSAGEWSGTLDSSACGDATQLEIDVRRAGRGDVTWTVPIER